MGWCSGTLAQFTVLHRVLVAGLTLSLSSMPVVAGATQPKPPTSASFYVTLYQNPQDLNKSMQTLGTQVGQHDLSIGATQTSVVILDFGQPWSCPAPNGPGTCPQTTGSTDYGVYWFVGTGYPEFFVSTSVIESAVEWFAYGYNIAVWNHTPTIVISVSTNNRESIYGPFVTSAHGKAWVKMVDNIGQFLTKNGYTHTGITGGINMEGDYSTPAAARSWIDGYRSLTTATVRYLYNYGDGAQCPSTGTGSTPAKCGSKNNWTQEDVWYVSWGANASGLPSGQLLPLPEIYNTTMARRWQQLSLYSYLAHGSRMIIFGSLTEEGACTQDNFIHWDSTCGTAKTNPWTPDQGWSALWTALNADTRTKQDLMYSTDIKYQ